MKTIKNYFTGTMTKVMLLLCLTLSFISCNEDEFEVINGIEPIPTPQALEDLFEAKTASLTNVITFDASTTLNYTSPKGVNLSIMGSCLRKNGNPVTGEVKVIYIEIFDKGDMLTSNKPTLFNNSGDKELLISGGEFYIQATQDEVNLTLACNINLDIPTALTGGTQTGMLPFTGSIDSDGELSWDQATTFEILTQGQAATPIYAAIIPSFGWFNCDKYYSTPGPKTTITSNVPAGYGENSAVFLAVKTFPSSLGKSYGQFPVGLDCYLIFVTEKDGMFRYAIKQQVLTENHQVFFTLAETTTGTADEFTTAINALP